MREQHKSLSPPRLSTKDLILVWSPSFSAYNIKQSSIEVAHKKIRDLGLNVTWSKNARIEPDILNSSSVEDRINDLHSAIKDPKVRCLMASRGGFNSNQILADVDWQLVAQYPKIYCAASDGTAFLNAIYAKTGIETYLGVQFYDFGYEGADYLIDSLQRLVFTNENIKIIPPDFWTDNKWETKNKNSGFWVLNEGIAEGVCIGGNLSTLCLLSGTQYMPSANDIVLFIEDDHYTEYDDCMFDRNLQSLIYQDFFKNVKGLVIGKFESGSGINQEKLLYIIKSKKELNHIAILGNADFSHTKPNFILPIGRKTKLVASQQEQSLEFLFSHE